jgi:hypothetical protein
VSAVLRFAGQARRSGAADTYRVARRELDARELGCLLLHLRRVDPDWRAPLKERRALAGVLLEAGSVIRRSSTRRASAGQRFGESGSKSPKGPATPHRNGPVFVSNGATLTRRSSGPILCCDASSANGDLEAIRDLLGAA